LRRFPFAQSLLLVAARTVAARFTVGVVGVVLDDAGQVLVVEHVFHPRSPWGLPGGWLVSGESPSVGLVREIAEETGLDVEVLRPLLIEVARYRGRHLDVAYLCAARGDVTALNLSREILDYKWLPPGDVPRMADFHQAAMDAYNAERAERVPHPVSEFLL
jgi:ADP-ribose pyrophosphatase YjhB (NUDIX family)